MESLPKSQDNGDADFTWIDYLLDTNSEATPPEAFAHVECSFKSGFEDGMKLEIPNPDDNCTYWIASVVVICSELLTLRYLGDDRSGDFWLDTKTAEFHPVGWCSANSKKLYPPKGLLEKHPEVCTLLEELKEIQNESALEDLQASFMPIHQIKCGMKIEVCEDMNSSYVWIATIMQNIGGRLLLRYDGSDSPEHDFWLFYLSDRLFSVGSALNYDMTYHVPFGIQKMHSDDKWNEILKKSIEDSKNFLFPAHVLQQKQLLLEHDFEEGMKLEAVDPENYNKICPATISKVVNKYYFLVSIDSFDESYERVMCCNSNSQLIFPVNWAQENSVDMAIPRGYKVSGVKFLWNDYLSFCNKPAAPPELFNMCCISTGFKVNQKLEAVDPLYHDNIYVATIEKIVEPVMFLHFDADSSNKKVITGVNSLDIYPMGWCASNFYPLHTPIFRSKVKTVATISNVADESVMQPPVEIKVIPQTEQHGKSWCPKIYFNHRCFTGPLLSKSRLAELPKAIGPGAVHLVMNEVISRVVNIAYKSSRVLQILQVHGKPSPGMQQQIIKAKYKGKSYRATIEVVRHSEFVEDFCKKICSKLECCPYLFGPKHVEDVCPSNCHTQTKTKFGYYFVKKKKPGRPPLAASSTISSSITDAPVTTPTASETGCEAIKRGPGRKKKRKHWTQLLAASEYSQKENINKSENSYEVKEEKVFKDEITADESATNDSPPSPKLNTSVTKKKLKHIPSSSIVTRGAKLPNFGLWHHMNSFHSKRGRPRTRPIRHFGQRKVGRPLGSSKKIILEKDSEDENVSNEEELLPAKQSSLKSNPMHWTVDEVANYIEKTDCAPIATLLKQEEIDGQALLMLNISNVQKHLNLKPEPAEKFCYIIKHVKMEFFTYFV